MSKSRIKNFIIVILGLLNLFLFSIVVTDLVQSSAESRLAERRLVEILARNGITLSEKARIPAKPPGLQSTHRDAAGELKLVRRVLGAVEVDDEGGSIYTYIGEGGRGYFRGTGEFSLEPAAESVHAGGSAVSAGSRYLRKMGISFDPELTELHSTGTLDEAVFVCDTPGGTVFNCRITFTFANGYLILITGRRAPDMISGENAEEALDAATVLLRFIDIIREYGYVCSEISALQAGYTLNSSASGEGTLTPVWRVSTDTGEYFINGITGGLEDII